MEHSHALPSGVRQRLYDLFLDLEAGTGNVEMRKCLHAMLIQTAIDLSATLFPDNRARDQMIERQRTAAGFAAG